MEAPTLHAPPTPAETNAITYEEFRKTVQRGQCPAARALAAFLLEPAQTQTITKKGDARTNIIDQHYRITYAMPDAAIQALFVLLEGVRRDGPISHFSERQGTPEAPTSGLVLDYDLIVADCTSRLQDRHALRVATQVVDALRRDLVFPFLAASTPRPEISLHVFTTIKPEPVPVSSGASAPGNCFKYGFHILVPGVRISRGYKKYLLRRLRENSAINRVLADLGVVGDTRECLDMNSASIPVLFLGSCKRGGVPYVLGPAFEISFGGAVASKTGTQPLRPYSEDFYPIVSALRPAELEASGYNLVAELSLCFEAQYDDGKQPFIRAFECTYRPELASEIEDLACRSRDRVIGEEELLFTEHALSTLAVRDPEARYLHQMLDLLDETFYTERNKWRDVIYALANTSESYKPLAEWFSHKCPAKWADGGRDSFDVLWDEAVARRSSVVTPLTRRSILRWAQLCNPERFRQTANQNYFIILCKYVHTYGGILEHAMVAQVLYAMLGNKFLVDVDETLAGRSPYVWFEFVVPGQAARPGEVWKWRREVEPDELQKYISNNLVKVFDQVAEHLNEQAAGADDEKQAKYYSKLETAFLSSRRKIFNDAFKNGVIKQANYLFRCRNFIETLDQDPLYIGVGNGVLRLGSTCTLIDHFHEIPIMKFTPVVCRGFDPKNPWTRLMLNAIADIIPEPDFRNWLLFFAASSLAGGVKEGLLLLWHGGGANGKTWFMRMVAKVLGKHYATKLDIGLLTAKRSKPNDPNSAIMQLKGMRWGYVEETRKAEMMNDQRLKELINPGEISGNEKFKRQETFEVTANVAVGQNYDFVVDTTDHGTWRRLKHYHSKVRFCSNPNPTNPFEKKEDQRYVREYINDPACLSAFLSILVHYYERLQQEYRGLLKEVRCPTLDRETEDFRNSQDSINCFITQSIVLSPGNGYEYTLAAVAQLYHEWYDKNIGRRTHVPSETIQDLENSALSDHIRLAANRVMVLSGCRILNADSPFLLTDEEFFGKTAGETSSEQKDLEAAPFAVSRKCWWEPLSSSKYTAALDDSFLFDDDSELPEPGAAARAAAHDSSTLLSDNEFENLLGDGSLPRESKADNASCGPNGVFENEPPP
ncbi:BA71V-C962R, partial [Elysia marginata]